MDIVEEQPREVDGKEIPVDLTKPSVNGEWDNLYLVRCGHWLQQRDRHSGCGMLNAQCFASLLIYEATAI